MNSAAFTLLRKMPALHSDRPRMHAVDTHSVGTCRSAAAFSLLACAEVGGRPPRAETTQTGAPPKVRCRIPLRSGFAVRYDWAGSSSTDARDLPLFSKIFDDRDQGGDTLFARWCRSDSAGRAALDVCISEIVMRTMWWKAYCASVKAQIRQVCQQGPSATAVVILIDGGPITRVEQMQVVLACSA